MSDKGAGVFNAQKIGLEIRSFLFHLFCMSANLAAFVTLIYLFGGLAANGLQHLDAQFFLSYSSRAPETSGILPGWVGTLLIMALTALVAIPMGTGAAIYLEEYATDSKLIRFVKLNIQNLAGVPSIIFGLLGLTLFVRGLGLGRSLISGALTMALVILPTIIIATQEALRAIPASHRHGGFGIGMTRWQVIRHLVLPMAGPGIFSGIILGMSRAVGETAPLLIVGAAVYVSFLPVSLVDSFTTLSLQIYNWASRPQQGFQDIAGSAILVLIGILLLLNSLAIYFRIRLRRRTQSWN